MGNTRKTQTKASTRSCYTKSEARVIANLEALGCTATKKSNGGHDEWTIRESGANFDYCWRCETTESLVFLDKFNTFCHNRACESYSVFAAVKLITDLNCAFFIPKIWDEMVPNLLYHRQERDPLIWMRRRTCMKSRIGEENQGKQRRSLWACSIKPNNSRRNPRATQAHSALRTSLSSSHCA